MTADEALDYDATPRRCVGARTRRYRGKLFVAGAEHAFELDELAAFVFCQIDGQASVRDIGTRLARQYGGRLSDALSDTAELVAELVRHRVLTLDARP